MKTYTHKGVALPAGQPFELEGVAYPWNWLDLASPEDLADRGIVMNEVPDVPVVPRIVTPRQARLSLLEAGLLDAVETAVNTAGGATKITWDYATEIDRNDPLILFLSAGLNISSAQLDALFTRAAVL